MEKLILIGQTLGYAAYFTFVIYMAHLITNKRIQGVFDPVQELVNNNMALAFRRIGLYLGLAIGMFGIIGANGNTFLTSLPIIVIETVMLFIFMYIGFLISNKVILHKVDNDQEIKNGKVSIGLMEMGQFIAIGIIAQASFSGEGVIWSSLVYFLLGQIVLTVIYYIYSKTINFDLVDALHNNNISASVLVSSIFVAYAIILKAAIEGPSNGWTADLIGFGTSAIFGVIMLLLLANKVIDHFFLPVTEIEDELKNDNYSAMIITGGLKIAIALGVSAVIF